MTPGAILLCFIAIGAGLTLWLFVGALLVAPPLQEVPVIPLVQLSFTDRYFDGALFVLFLILLGIFGPKQKPKI